MSNYTEQDFKDFSEDQGIKCGEGYGYDALVTFVHEEEVIVDPYAYTDGDPVILFGATAMAAWKAEAAALMTEWAADAA
jgi:hypothetical protein